MMTRRMMAAYAAAAWCACSFRVSAAESCTTVVRRSTLARCVIAASVALQRERFGVEAFRGREQAVSPLLPSNPLLALSGAHRSKEQSKAGNWTATLSQELEIAGQRSARREAASAATTAQQHLTLATQRDVAAEAWRVYFEALAARDALDTATRLEQALAGSRDAASVGAAQGLVSGVDAQLTELTLLRLTQTRIEAQQRVRHATSELASLMGLNPRSATLTLEGELKPLSGLGEVGPQTLESAVEQRAEVASAKQAVLSQDRSTAALQRSRVPNLTLSVFAQQDGFGERVLGGGLSVPVPLPAPLGRTFSGQISESEALTRRAEAELESVRRAARLELVEAFQALESAKERSALFTDTRVAEAERSLQSIAEEIRAGRIAISAAVVTQQALIEFLRARIDAKLDVCLASVEVARTAGVALDGEQP